VILHDLQAQFNNFYHIVIMTKNQDILKVNKEKRLKLFSQK
jgi:hypothetical protein